MNQASPDWSLLEDENAVRVAQRAAVAEFRHKFYGTTLGALVSRADLEQEALLALAMQGRTLAHQPGLLYRNIRQRLTDAYRTEHRRASNRRTIVTSLDAMRDLKGYEPCVDVQVVVPDSDYSPALIEWLLPSVWQSEYGKSIALAERGPRRSGLVVSSSLPAMRADAQSAWRHAPLTTAQRRALLLAAGLGWTQTEIAVNQGCAQSTVSTRIKRGLLAMCHWLNRAEHFEKVAA